MTILWSNNASTTVSGSITTASTTVNLAAGTGTSFPNPTGGNYYVATFYDQATKTQNEIVHVTAMAGDVATIVRAQEGTTAKAWNAGDIFANLVTAGTLNAFVQAGTGPANTSIVYVGTDTSATPGTIIATTNPVPASLAIGMLFNIKVANTTPGTTMMQLNGLAGIETVRTDGSHMVGGNLVAGEEYMFVYNGTNFTSTIPPIPQSPPQTVFYVNPTGNDNNTGFANTSAQAFATIQGAINQIKARYISQTGITIRVANGTYTSGMQDTTNYIASWNIIGNTTTPSSCTIDARSTSGASYITGAPQGGCVIAGGSTIMQVSGFNFLSYYANITCEAGGVLTLQTCYFNAPTSGAAPVINVGNGGGVCALYGNFQYFGTIAAGSFLNAGSGGTINIGYYDTVFGSTSVNIFINGTPTITYTAQAGSSGQIAVHTAVTSFSGGTPVGHQYAAYAGGGIIFYQGNTSVFPGTIAGTVTSPGWTA